MFFISYFFLELLEVSLWTIDDVANFIRKIHNVKAVVQVFIRNEIDGRSFMKLTVDELTRHPYNLPGGPAKNIFEEIQKLQRGH